MFIVGGREVEKSQQIRTSFTLYAVGGVSARTGATNAGVKQCSARDPIAGMESWMHLWYIGPLPVGSVSPNAKMNISSFHWKEATNWTKI